MPLLWVSSKPESQRGKNCQFATVDANIGDLQPTSRTWANAQAFASMNNVYLAQCGVHAVATGISVDAGEDTVLVQVSASLDRLFPSVVPNVVVTERGYAEIQAFTR
jgi:hypothetical protein